MAKRKQTSTSVSTNYGSGKLADGTAITFLGDINNGVIDSLNATVQTPAIYKGRRITRQSNTTNIWALVPL